jgi:LPXTG-site transpeptidase (sortase) family protein
MQDEFISDSRRARYYSSVTLVYAITLLFAFVAFKPVSATHNLASATNLPVGYHAQYAMMTPLANDNQGNTFIYGHNNKYVFGPLKKINQGSIAKVYTDSGKVFYYWYQSTYAVTPDNTSVLDYQGPSILTIQTCSGSWNEQRQMYVFTFDKVETM